MEDADQNNSSSGSAGGSENSHHSPDKSKGKKTKRRPKTPVKSAQPNPSPSETEEEHDESVLNRGFLLGRDFDIIITPDPNYTPRLGTDPGPASSDTEDIDATKGPYRIQGMRWGVGVDNSCPVDPLLTSLKLWFLRTKYSFEGNFHHTEGDGLALENVLRYMMTQLTVTRGGETLNQAWRNSRDMQIGWARHLHGAQLPLRYNMTGTVEDRAYEAMHFVSSFSYQYHCQCRQYERKSRSSIWIGSRQQFENWIDLRHIPDKEIKDVTCNGCNTFLECHMHIPRTTWILIIRFGAQYKFKDLNPIHLVPDQVPFRLAQSVYNTDLNPGPGVFVGPEDAIVIDSDPEDSAQETGKSIVGPPSPPSPPVGSASAPYGPVTGHITARIFQKGEAYEYDSMESGGALKAIPNEERLTDRANTCLESAVYVRVPPIRLAGLPKIVPGSSTTMPPPKTPKPKTPRKRNASGSKKTAK
jgi:hypothetical protein